MKKIYLFTIYMLGILAFYACGSDDSNDVVAADDDTVVEEEEMEEITGSGSTPVAAFDDFNSDAVSVSFDGDQITITSNGLPNHTSPYWSTDSDLYIEPVVANEEGISPGTIRELTYTLTVDASPEIAASSSATGLGAIGISITGVPIYNDQEGMNVALSASVASGFDWSGGHVGPTGYHYHIESSDVTENGGQLSYDDHQLVGIMADGFLLYGRRDNADGDYPDDLDESGGHVGTTQHSDEPFYHYHIINEFYIDEYIVLFGVDLQGTPSTIM